ncbi:MAG TPA: PDZ domain-containing protein [Gemmatimonadaceae bacterium]|nr:PDZ domain-containing protein [Gemmatimonadaceae bacterium]
MLAPLRIALSLSIGLAALAPAPAPAQRPPQAPAVASPTAPSASAPISDVRYTITFDRSDARRRSVRVAMAFTTAGNAPVVLSLPAWTPGAYELSYFARWVTEFSASRGDGKSLHWEKLDYDSWRVDPAGARSVTVSFRYLADSLDNAMTWAGKEFLLFNGTNLFLYPEGRGFDFPSTVAIRTEPDWRVATGMHPAGAPATYSAATYHDLVDMPAFIGRFDLDSARVADRWIRLATYPEGSVAGPDRQAVWRDLIRMIPPMVAVWGDVPFDDYTVMQIADSTFGGASGLEHQSSHVDVISPLAIGDPFMPTLYAHEIFHAWNVKRLRPADLWPYQYAHEQPTPWLWECEGITDYYADLALVRGGVTDSAGFFRATAGKIQEVAQVPPVALEDASLSTWIHPLDGSAYIYYPQGSLAGLALDILIRDASDDRRSLDDVLRQLYRSAYQSGQGFTEAQWWSAVSAAAGGKSFADFDARYIDGRVPIPWDSILPRAGMRLAVDTIPEPRFGVSTLPDSEGVRVIAVEPDGSAAEAGVQPGDYLVSIGDIPVDERFAARFRAAFDGKNGAPLAIRVRRDGRDVMLAGRLRIENRFAYRVEVDANASERAARIRAGILHGHVDGAGG